MLFIKPLWLAFATVILTTLYPAMSVNADEIRPALLDIKEQNTGLFAVTWKVPTRGNQVLPITPTLPESLELLGSPTVQDVHTGLYERRNARQVIPPGWRRWETAGL